MTDVAESMPFTDPDLPVETRARDFVERLTLEEKASQMGSFCRAIERLGVPPTRMGGEGIHGLARVGRATVFPQALMLASTFNEELLFRVGEVVATEARAKFNRRRERGMTLSPGLLTWSPNVNIFRDPRWGRGQETYGEDPHLSSRMAVRFIRGLAGDDPIHLRMGAGVKHYVVHSGPEAKRHGFDARVGLKDLYETYLPAFAAAFREADAAAVMASYNQVNGHACCASKWILGEILREQLGFDGMVLSDGGGLDRLHDPNAHALAADAAESCALALNNGCEMCLGRTYESLPEAVRRGLVAESVVDAALMRITRLRIRLGLFDPSERVTWSNVATDVIDCEEHRALARQAARESMVLLKNDGLLPLPDTLESIGVLGPCAGELTALLGNYSGHSGRMVTPLEGIVARVSPGTGVRYERGCDPASAARGAVSWSAAKVSRADTVVAVLGGVPALEGEEYDAPLSDDIGDRYDLRLPGVQENLLRQVVDAADAPVVLVLTGCWPYDIAWALEHCAAVVHMGYGGEEGGAALADLLFGDADFSGRLPVTWPRSLDQLPPYEDYALEGRTYRYMRAEPLLPFGYGLSYTTFDYDGLSLSASELAAGEELTVRVHVTNTGDRPGREVVQLYLTSLDAPGPKPIRSLTGFRKVPLGPGESSRVLFTITPRQMARIDEHGRALLEPGRFRITVGGSQGDALSTRLTGRPVLAAEFAVTGAARELPY